MTDLISLIVLTAAIAYLWGKASSFNLIAKESLLRSIEASIAIKALEKSSHTLIPVKADMNGLNEKDLESKLRSMAGLPMEDYEHDLARAGFDIDPPEDQV